MYPNIDLFDSYLLVGMASEIVPAATFFKNRYFPTTNEDIYAFDKVLVEYRDGDRKIAPFVHERSEGIPVARQGYSIREYSPPQIKPTRILTLDDLRRRGFGEALLRGTPPEERARRLILSDMVDLDLRITRREEWMCAQLLQSNKLTAVAYIDDKTVGVPFVIQYYDEQESNPTLYTVSDTWDVTGDFFGDVEAMVASLADRGLPATDLVVGPSVAQYILDNPKVRELLDNRRFEIGQIAPRTLAPGVAFLGRLNFGGWDLDIYVVREGYVDDSGTSKRYFPANAALVTAPNCGHMMYAQVTQMDEVDRQFHDIAQPRVPRVVSGVKANTRELELTSRPLPAPRTKAPFIFAPNVVS